MIRPPKSIAALALGLSLAAVACHSSGAEPGPIPGMEGSGQALDGPTLYTRRCATRHGTAGLGDGRGSTQGVPANLTDPELQARLTDEAIANTIRNGVGDMLPITALRPEEIDAIVQYVRTLAH